MAEADSKAKKAAYDKARYAANKEKNRVAYAAYYAANKAKICAKVAEYRLANAAACKERAARWVKNNLERVYQTKRRSAVKNAEKYRARERMAYAENPAIDAARRAKYHAKFPWVSAHLQRLACLRRIGAVPPWADVEAIKAMYKEAARLTKTTGLKYDVDHIVPIKHWLVCGLHVLDNLQILTHTDNRRKHNKFGDKDD